ncbi:Kelch repeat type 1-containing protein [Nitrospira japonica]|uniref:Kelch repeat type 1-containing protein n=1 Tax=Nitrospira japonica TaxID=1325564 RepID=A0A1W1I8Z3_9BACT|nr:kelch repeat-containing protein [Nitrospira japonica]SLM49484.1 Kelch repeat type 1-containing protein [Nitrospira japonica]
MLHGLLLVCLLPQPSGAEPTKPDPGQGAWRTARPASLQRTEAVAVTVNGKIYVVGGFEPPGVGTATKLAITPALEEYDPASDRWTARASMPMGLHHTGIGAVGGLVYVIGGYKQSGLSIWQPVASVYAYDPAADKWTERAPMPTARGALAVAELDGMLYAIGGFGEKGNSPAVEIYDPAHDRWMPRTPLPTPRDHLAVVALNRKIYAIGGRLNGDYQRNLAVTEVYDPAVDRWESAPPLPTARSGIAAVSLGNRLYVFGGEGPEGTFRENEAYDPARHEWQRMAPMPTGRHGLGAASLQGGIHVIDGGPTPGGSFSNLHEIFTPPSR